MKYIEIAVKVYQDGSWQAVGSSDRTIEDSMESLKDGDREEKDFFMIVQGLNE